jgi:hypothetical protein
VINVDRERDPVPHRDQEIGADGDLLPASIQRPEISHEYVTPFSRRLVKLLAVAVQRREERGRLERGVPRVAEFPGDTGERGVRRVGFPQALSQTPAGDVSDAGLDVQALLNGGLSLLAVEFDAIGHAGGRAVRVPQIQVPRADLVTQVPQAGAVGGRVSSMT